MAMSTRKQRNQQHDGDSSRLHSLFLFVALLAVLFVDDGLGVDALQHTPQTRRNVGERIAATLASLTVIKPRPAVARPEGVNKPSVPAERSCNVIDVKVNFLTPGEQKRIQKLTEQIEKTSGFKLRVFCQSYPETPGLAIKDYWKVDDKTIVLIADKGLKGTSNILNFNVGDGLAADVLPDTRSGRLQGRFGTSRYWRDEGEDVAITNAVGAIAYCLQRDSDGDVTGCTDPPSATIDAVVDPRINVDARASRTRVETPPLCTKSRVVVARAPQKTPRSAAPRGRRGGGDGPFAGTDGAVDRRGGAARARGSPCPFARAARGSRCRPRRGRRCRRSRPRCVAAQGRRARLALRFPASPAVRSQSSTNMKSSPLLSMK